MKKWSIFLTFLVVFLGACSEVRSPKQYTSESTAVDTVITIETLLTSSPEQTPTYSEITETTVIPSKTPLLPTSTVIKPTPTKTIPPLPELTRNLKLEDLRMRGEDVTQLQTWLLALGFSSVGIADGVFGELTDSAVRQFQQNYNLTVDGVVGPVTWEALYKEVYNAPEPTATQKSSTAAYNFDQLAVGDSGDEVEELQRRLISLDYPVCEQNDQFDLQTEAAVRLFQKGNDLTATGIVDRETWFLMKSMAALAYEPEDVPVILSSRQFVVENGVKALVLDKGYLWFSQNDQIIKFDPDNLKYVTAIDVPYLGKKTGLDGLEHDVEFQPLNIFPPGSGNQVWLLGAYGYGYGPGTHAMLAINTAGNMEVEPVLFPGDFDYAGVQDALQAGEEIWMFHQYAGEVTMYYLDFTGGLVPVAYLGYEFSDTTAYEFDGNQLWAMIAMEGNALVPVDPYQAVYGRAIGPCGDDIAWDGNWFWIKRDNVLFAYDQNGILQAKAAPPDGFRISEFVANGEYIIASASGKGKNYLIFFEK